MKKMTYQMLPEHVKRIGRYAYLQDILWCGLSGSGVSFQATGTRLSITLTGDDSTAGNVTEGLARVAVYVNDTRVIDVMMDQPEKVLAVWNLEQPQTACVQIIKLSESAMSTVGIKEVQIESTQEPQIVPTPDKKHRLEFIGDSITCGYGVDNEDPLSHFLTDTEDVTRAYAYRTAKKLDADYSMCSFSGYGIISGYTENGLALKTHLVPPYYEKVGFSYGKPFGEVQLAELDWDFSLYQPELVVVNLGTNDDSYCQDDPYRQQEFCEQYAEFIKVVRAHNPQAQLLCTVGTMCERIAEHVEKAVSLYQEQTGDERISYYKLPLQIPEDGLVSDYHPTAVTHEKAAVLLSAKIKEILGIND